MKPTVNVLYLPGTNCEAETMRAFRQVGADPRLVYPVDVITGRVRLDDADILCLPGGFAFGDHLGAGVVAGLLLRTTLGEQFRACLGRPILAICNGFQIAVHAGCFGPAVTLTVNDSGTFRDIPHQEHIVASNNPSPWLQGLAGTVLRFPCAHGEGRFAYTDTAGWLAALRYPAEANPDGSADGIAGITSGDGMILGLMNHPERAMDPTMRLALFENGKRAAAG